MDEPIVIDTRPSGNKRPPGRYRRAKSLVFRLRSLLVAVAIFAVCLTAYRGQLLQVLRFKPTYTAEVQGILEKTRQGDLALVQFTCHYSPSYNDRFDVTLVKGRYVLEQAYAFNGSTHQKVNLVNKNRSTNIDFSSEKAEDTFQVLLADAVADPDFEKAIWSITQEERLVRTAPIPAGMEPLAPPLLVRLRRFLKGY